MINHWKELQKLLKNILTDFYLELTTLHLISRKSSLYVYHLYDRLWKLVGEEVTYKVNKGNYIKLFDDARKKVRAWEKANVK